jgi:HEAT repeat protein
MTDLESLRACLAELTCGNDQRAEAAAQALGAFGAAALAPLRTLLSSPDPEMRWWALRALSEIDSPEAVRLAVQSLHDPDLLVQRGAALLLRRRPAESALPALGGLLAHPDSLLARLAGDALAALGSPAVPALLEVMKNGSPAARSGAVRALAEIRDGRAIPALFAALDDDSLTVQHWANLGLERLGVGMTFFKPD